LISSGDADIISIYKGGVMRYFSRTFTPMIFLVFVYIIVPAVAFCGKVYIPKGTEIPVKFKSDITSDRGSKPSSLDIFQVASNQKISGVGVIRQGDAVYCEIIKFKKPGLLGGGGEIEIRIDSVQTALGKNIKVDSESLKAKGKSKRLKALLMLPILGYGILIRGDHAELGRQNDTITLKTSELEQISF
jgi:hypothetical protein